MPRVSRASLSKTQLEEINQHFTYLISSLQHDTDIEDFLYEFLTPEEKIMLAKRLVMFMMLEKDYPEDSIKHILHLSHETIRTYRNSFADKSPIFQKIIQKLIRREKTKMFFKKLEKVLSILDTISQSKTNMKARAKILSADW